MPNEHLLSAMRGAGMEVDDLASLVGVDVKTARRWVSGERTPYPRYRHKITQALKADVRALWPHLETAAAQRKSAGPGDLQAVYLSADHIPDWRELATESATQIDLFDLTLGQIITSKADSELLTRLTESGVALRVLVSSSDSLYLHQRRGGFAHEAPSPVRDLERTRRLLDPLSAAGLIEIRTVVAPATYTILRFDSTMLVSLHLAGSDASQTTVLQLEHHVDPGLFDRFAEHYEATWTHAEPDLHR